MNHRRDKSLGHVIAHYAGSKYYRQILGAVTVFLRPKLLTPEQYGLWTLLKMIVQYTSSAHLGTQSAMRFLLPRYRSRGDCKHADILRYTAFGTGLTINLVLAGAAGALALIPAFNLELRFGLVTLALLILLHFYHDHLISLLKAEEAFGIVTASVYVYVTAAFVTTVPLLYFFHIYGLFLSMVMTYVITILQLHTAHRFQLLPRFDRQALKELLSKGFPMFLTGFTIVLITSSDKIVVSIMLGKESLGYYGIALIVFNILINIPGTTREVLEPRLMRTCESRPLDSIMEEYFFKPLLNTAYLMPLLIGPLYFLLPIGIPLILPRYSTGIEAARILSLGVYFLALSYVPIIIIVARNWQLEICRWLPPILILNLVLSILLVRFQYGLAGVAFASAFSFMLLLILFLVFIRLKTDRETGGGITFIGWLTLPAAVMFGMIFIVGRAIAVIPTGPLTVALSCTVVYTLVMVCLYLFAAGKLSLIRFSKSEQCHE